MKTYEFSREGLNRALSDAKKYERRMHFIKIGGKIVLLSLPLALIFMNAPGLFMFQDSTVAFKASYDAIDSIAFKLIETGL